MPVFALTVFAAAFLVFQVQPLLGKFILPWFGGGPGVWTTCLLFFQVLLLAGYAWAHLLASWLRPRQQVLAHLALVAAALLLLPVTPAQSWKPLSGAEPVWHILRLLAATVGLPYFVLSATGPLLQHWFGALYPGRSPYRLYALSNVGSLLALVSYPFFFEVRLTRLAQARFWGWGLAVYALCCAACAWKLWKANAARAAGSVPAASAPPEACPTGFSRLLWILLPACASVLLLATTNKLCQDVAVMPFLWVLPLALYLASFIVCFENPRWYARVPLTLALVLALGGLAWALCHGSELALPAQIVLYCGGLFVCCLVCHGELYRLRPPPRFLTGFYLAIALGGALGGLFVAVLAPLLFSDYFEMQWGMVACAALLWTVCLAAPSEAAGPGQARSWPARLLWPQNEWRALGCALPLMTLLALDWFLARLGHGHAASVQGMVWLLRGLMWLLALGLAVSWLARGMWRSFRYWRFLTCLWLGFGLAVLALTLWQQSNTLGPGVVGRARSFYGVLAVKEVDAADPLTHQFRLVHGRVTHGLQLVAPERRSWPTAYFGAGSGADLAFKALPAAPRRIGIIGLGVGTLAAYGRAGDSFRFYELNPEVVRLARSRFSFLAQCPAQVEIVPGDARLALEREAPQQLDLLVLDAFSGDAIPAHLLTREAFALYWRHLQPAGLLALHLSNRHLELEPVVRRLAQEAGWAESVVRSRQLPAAPWLYPSEWVLLARRPGALAAGGLAEVAPSAQPGAAGPLWTDDFASLFAVLKKTGRSVEP